MQKGHRKYKLIKQKSGTPFDFELELMLLKQVSWVQLKCEGDQLPHVSLKQKTENVQGPLLTVRALWPQMKTLVASMHLQGSDRNSELLS